MIKTCDALGKNKTSRGFLKAKFSLGQREQLKLDNLVVLNDCDKKLFAFFLVWEIRDLAKKHNKSGVWMNLEKIIPDN